MRRVTWSERQRWWLLAAAWLVLLVLGVGGFIQQSRDLDLDYGFLDHLYLTLQLAALDYKGASSAINWRLQVARFAAPGIAAGTLLQSASVVFREQFRRWRAARARGHTVVCGLGQVGARLTHALVAEGRRVVAISGDANLATTAARAAGIPIVMGDPADPAVLAAARADRAARVVAAWDQDAVNVATAAAVNRLDRPRDLPPVRVAVRLLDGELAHLLRSVELGTRGTTRLEFFNVQDRAAHALLNDHPLTGEHDAKTPHLVVAGIGQFGAGLVLAAAQQWAAHGDGPLCVTLIDRQAAGRLNALRMRHPALAGALEATCIGLDFRAPADGAIAEFERVLTDRPPTLAVSAFEDEALAWTAGLFIRRRATRPVDVVVRTATEGGFGEHLSATIGGRSDGGAVGGLGRVIAFPFLDRACTADLIEGGVREQLARALHTDHVARAGQGAALHRDWAELSDAERESSRAAADAIVERLDTIGARLVPLAGWDLERNAFSDAELELLAATEHARWKAEREQAGWRWGAIRDDAARLNPLLLDWDDLPDDARRSNREAAQALPALLARAGFEIAR